MKAIQTMFRDIQMRSRLEATWACFFELCKWPWEYEPFDMPGWIPDFVLAGHVLVEVKPFPPGDFEAWSETITKITSAWSQCWSDHRVDSVLLLGTSPQFGGCKYCQSSLGWLSETIHNATDTEYRGSIFEDGSDLWIEEAAVGYIDGLFDFCHAVGSYRGRIHNRYHGGSLPLNDGFLVSTWNRAKNLTQWKPRVT